MQQLIDKHEIAMNKLLREKHDLATEKERLRSELDALKKRYQVPEERESKEGKYSEY
jgi:hypothetical protein